MEVFFVVPTLWCQFPLKSVNILAQGSSSSQPWLDCLPPAWPGDRAWAVPARTSFLGGLAGASLRLALGLPQWEGASLALSSLHSHSQVWPAGADLAPGVGLSQG